MIAQGGQGRAGQGRGKGQGVSKYSVLAVRGRTHTHIHTLSLFSSSAILSLSLAGSHTHRWTGGVRRVGVMGQPASRDSPLDYRTLGVPALLGRVDFPTPKCQTPAHDLPRPSPGRDHDIGSKIGTAFLRRTVRTALQSPDLSCVFAALKVDVCYGRPIDCWAEPTRSGTELRGRYTVREEHGKTLYPVLVAGQGPRYLHCRFQLR